MKRIISVLITLAMLLTAGAFFVVADEHEHNLIHMRNDASHYSECTICFELFNVGDHTMENGVCTVCNYPNEDPRYDKAEVGDHEHTLMHMRNAASHYSECTVCYELFNVGDHTMENGVCTVCNYPNEDSRNAIIGEGEHEHILMNMANMVCHYEECQVCFELFNVGDHTFVDGKCSVCGHPELINPFEDVAADAWYTNDVAAAAEMGLINGKSATEFKPDDYLTYAEAIKLAACMNQKYLTGEVTLANGDPWYMPYADYCFKNNIIDQNYPYTDYTTRAGYMYIFARALPDEALPVINNIPDGAIPDVPAEAPYAWAVYKLYRAGIVTGVDSFHNCNPTANIKRSEVATILVRMMDPSRRVRFDMSLSDNITTGNDVKLPDGNDFVGVIIPTVDIPDIDINTGNDLTIDSTKTPVRMLTNPTSVEVEGYSATATLVAEAQDGTGVYTYQWKYRDGRETFDVVDDGFNILGANTSKLSILVTPTGKLVGKPLYCVISDANGTSVNSTAASVYGPFFMKVEQRTFEEGKGMVVVGTLSDGILKKGDKISVERNGKIVGIGTVTGIEMFDKNLDEAVKGDRVGLIFATTLGVSPVAGDTIIRYQDYHVVDTSDIVN
ncbi:MAG: hypothetical protein E7656_07565 [Ruminococcaceae bacterium]|nr:hypothetical protein [Oscillospiraceae bacterium]